MILLSLTIDSLKLGILVCIMLALLSGCATPKYMSNDVSQEAINIAAEEIESDMKAEPKFLDDVKAEALVYEIYNELLPAAINVCRDMGEDECGWDVVYSTDEEFNAFASNESTVTINKGILKYAKNDDEVAFVIAHELSHHAANHIEESTKNMQSGAILGMLITGLASAYANQGTYMGQYNVQRDMESGAKLGAMMGRLSYSTGQESEADHLASLIMYQSGFRLENARGTFKLMAAIGKGPHGDFSLFKTHPSPAERLARWDQSLREINMSDGQLVSIKEREKQLSNPDNGDLGSPSISTSDRYSQKDYRSNRVQEIAFNASDGSSPPDEGNAQHVGSSIACAVQLNQIEEMRSTATTNAKIMELNHVVGDYNRQCASRPSNISLTNGGLAIRNSQKNIFTGSTACSLQHSQIEEMRGLATSNAQITKLNRLVSDYNKQCANRR